MRGQGQSGALDASVSVAKEELQGTIAKLEEAAKKWNDNIVREKAASTGLSSAVTSYASYMSQLNETLNAQLQQYAGVLESEQDYGLELQRLKHEFETRIERERALHRDIQSRYEDAISKLQADASRDAELRSADERKRRMEVEGKLRASELHLSEAKRKFEVAKAEADAARAAVEDANAMLSQSESAANALRTANDRLKEKLRQEQALRESEAQSKLASMKQWQTELKEAREIKAGAEGQIREAVNAKRALEDRVRELEASNARLDSQLAEAKKGQEDFVYSLQRANERLKEKLQTTEESRARLVQQIAEQEELAAQNVVLGSKVDESARRIKALEMELNKAAHYKEDWLVAVKQRVLAEERGSVEGSTTRSQLEETKKLLAQTEQRLGELNAQHTQETRVLREKAAQLDAVQAQLVKEQDRAAKLEAFSKEHKEQARVAKQHSDKLAGQLQEAQSQHQQTLALVQDQLRQKDAEIQRLASRVLEEGSVGERSREKERLIEKLSADVQRLQKQVEELERTLQAESRTRQSFEVANAQLEKEVAVYREAHVEDLPGRVQDLLNSSANMAQQVTSQSQRYEQLSRELREASQLIEQLKGDVLRHEHHFEEASSTAKLWKERYELAQATANKEDEVNRALILRSQDQDGIIEQLRAQVATLQKRDRDADGRIAELLKTQDANAALVVTLQGKLSALEAEDKLLRQKLAAVEHDGKVSVTQLHDLKQRSSATEKELEGRLSALSTQEQAAREQVIMLRSELEARARGLEDLQREVSSIRQEFMQYGASWMHLVGSALDGPSYAERPFSPAALSTLLTRLVGSHAAAKVLEEPADVDPAGRQLFDELFGQVRSTVEEKAGVIFRDFRLVQSAVQQRTNGGESHFFKVVTDSEAAECVWLCISEDDKGEAWLQAAKGPVPSQEPLVFFEEWDLHGFYDNGGVDDDYDDGDDDGDDDDDDDDVGNGNDNDNDNDSVAAVGNGEEENLGVEPHHVNDLDNGDDELDSIGEAQAASAATGGGKGKKRLSPPLLSSDREPASAEKKKRGATSSPVESHYNLRSPSERRSVSPVPAAKRPSPPPKGPTKTTSPKKAKKQQKKAATGAAVKKPAKKVTASSSKRSYNLRDK